MADDPPGAVVTLALFSVLALAVVLTVAGAASEGAARTWRLAWLLVLLGAGPYAAFVADPATWWTATPVLGVTMVLMLWGGLGAPGKALARRPLAFWLGLQTFRLPLEILLHQLHEEGRLPAQMTWEGANLDVISGVVAPLGALVVARTADPRLRRGATWVVTLVGLPLLANVMRIALLSLPHGATAWSREAPLLLPYDVPFVYVVPAFVGTALLGHLVAIRQLLGGVGTDEVPR